MHYRSANSFTVPQVLAEKSQGTNSTPIARKQLDTITVSRAIVVTAFVGT